MHKTLQRVATSKATTFKPLGFDYDKSYSKVKCVKCGGDVFPAISPGASPPISMACTMLTCRYSQ